MLAPTFIPNIRQLKLAPITLLRRKNMKNSFTKIEPAEIDKNPFKLVGEDWMLITAGSSDAYNTMTASWGGMGVLWSKNVVWCVIRPQRYTYEFMEKADTFTLSFFDEKFRDALMLCGTKSGREIDKAAATGLTPVDGNLDGTTAFKEARLVIECKKIYFQDLIPRNFIDPSIDDNYPQKDYHRMFFGEIINCWVK
jgi:flavin reductase (DIM6/NTAB) family NADH-FMN oxidoreductase RutF